MNIYEDYQSYMEECSELIEVLKTNGKEVYYAISDVIKVTKYILNEYLHHQTIDEDLDEIFDIGYGFLANVLSDMKTYYEDAFDKNPKTFEKYSELLLYSIYVEDFKSFLESEELMNEDILQDLNDILMKLDGIFTHQKEYDENLPLEINAKLTELGLEKFKFRPAYSVFQLICEELNLE